MLPHIAGFLHTLLSFVGILSLIVFLHEFGHYLIARLCGVRILEFSIGFGKEIYSWKDKHDTRWKISLIPMGGYVKMFGDASEASAPDAQKLENMSEQDKAISFHFKPLWKKAAIVFAGPAANFILTICIFTGFIFTYGVTTADPIVGEILPDSPALEAGLQAGDRVLSVNATPVEHFRDIPRLILTNMGTPVELKLQRGNETIIKIITPRFIEETDSLGNKSKRPMIGFKSQRLTVKEVGIAGALVESMKQTWDITMITGEYLGQVIKGDRSAKEMKGPLGIAKMSGQATEKGLYTVLWFMALLSANLGFINLLPIPPLDGGHLLFYTLEGMRGRPLALKFQEYSFRAGFALVLSLMVFTIFNDVRDLVTGTTDTPEQSDKSTTPSQPKK